MRGVISSSFSRRRRWFAAPSTWSIATPSRESGNRALRYSTPDARSVARPSIIRQRRSDRTSGRCARSTPARLSLGQCANDKFSPTSTKYERSTGDCTAIIRQFAQSAPSTEGSIWSRRGNRPARAIFVHRCRTRSTSRRLNTIFTASERCSILHLLGGHYNLNKIFLDYPSLCVEYRLPALCRLCSIPKVERTFAVPGLASNFASDGL